MLDYARGRRGSGKAIELREADATNLPFSDGEFGAVVCGFGFMFVPDKERRFARRAECSRKAASCSLACGIASR